MERVEVEKERLDMECERMEVEREESVADGVERREESNSKDKLDLEKFCMMMKIFKDVRKKTW